jgi:hypothetical protein
MKKTWLQSISLFALLLVLVGHGYAQGIVTGSISGTIQDPTGAVVSSAKVSATNVATGITQTVPSKTNGDFTLSVLPIGLYKLQIEAQGFDILTLSNVSVTTGVVTGLGIEKLKLGSASESVEVSTAENLLETTQSMVTTTFDSVQVGNLPTGGGFDELALLIPGVVSVRGNSRSNTNGASISSNGQRGRNNNFELDGQSNNDNSVAGPQVFFSNQDAIQEIQVVTNNFGAQYGRDAGSVVNYITKSGTNGIHGTAFYSYEGSWLSSITQGNKGPQFGYCLPGVSPSTGCTAVKKPRFDNNTWGGSLGAPIIKNKLFGFGSALFANNLNGQTQYNSASVGSTSGYTPTPAGVAQLAAAFPNNAAVQSLVKFGPYAIQYGTLAQIPGSSANVTVSDGTTSATIPVSLYSRTFGSKSTDEEVLGRLDYQATSRDRIFVRYFYQKNPSLPSNATATGGIVNVTDIAHAIGGDWSHTFNSKVVNQLRYSFQQTKLTFDGGAFPNCTTTTFTTCPTSVGVSTSSAYRLPAVASGGSTVPASINSISSFGLSTSYPQGRIVKDNQVQDNLTLNLGKHSLTVGASYEFQNSPNVFLPNISGGFTFFGANGLLQDAGQVGLAKGNPNIHFTEPDIAAYVQDDWKVRSDLTLNLGMRWEFFGQSVNLLHDLSLANQTGSSPLWNTALPQSETVFPYTKPDYKHFEPRIGFAYNPAGTGGLVIRGGYSLSISPAFYNIFLNSYGSAPVVLAATITGCNNTTKICLPGGGANYASVHALDDQYLPTGGSPGSFNQTLVGSNFKQPVTQTYSLGIQKAVSRIGVVEVRYVGAHTSGDFQSVNANPAIGFAAGAFPSKFAGVSYCTTTTGLGYNGGNGRLDCNNGNIRSRNNSAFEIYNGLQTSIKTQAYHGLTANFGYTWSRTIDNASEIFGTNGAGTTVAFSQNPRDTNVGERGVSGNSFPNVTSLGLVYASPFLKQNHSLLGKALGGFQFNTIYLFNSGQPFTPYQAAAPSGSEANFCDYNFDSSFAGVSTCRPILANPNAPLGSVGYNAATTNATHTALTSPSSYVDLATGNPVARSAEHWLVNNYAEALALGNPYPGVGRNTLRGGSFNNMDASVFKNNKINERLNLQLQVTVFNLLNRAYYGAPDAAIEDAGSTFANFTGNGGSNRNVTLGGRIVF